MLHVYYRFMSAKIVLGDTPVIFTVYLCSQQIFESLPPPRPSPPPNPT